MQMFPTTRERERDRDKMDWEWTHNSWKNTLTHWIDQILSLDLRGEDPEVLECPFFNRFERLILKQISIRNHFLNCESLLLGNIFVSLFSSLFSTIQKITNNAFSYSLMSLIFLFFFLVLCCLFFFFFFCIYTNIYYRLYSYKYVWRMIRSIDQI